MCNVMVGASDLVIQGMLKELNKDREVKITINDYNVLWSAYYIRYCKKKIPSYSSIIANIKEITHKDWNPHRIVMSVDKVIQAGYMYKRNKKVRYTTNPYHVTTKGKLLIEGISERLNEIYTVKEAL